MRFFPLILSLAVSALITSSVLRAEDAVNAPAYLVTYFEVAPSAVTQTADLVRQYANASRNEDGNAAVDGLEETGRPNRFAIVEVWRDKKAAESHNSSAGAGAYPSIVTFANAIPPNVSGKRRASVAD